MRVLMVTLLLASMPLATSAAQGQGNQGQDKGKDVCALPEGGARRGPPAAARDRALNSGQGKKVGLTRGANGCVAEPPVVEPPVVEPPVVEPPPVVEMAEIHGTAFGDVDASFNWSAGETGLADRTITLSGPVSASTLTDADGNYSFVGLPVGTYVVCQEPDFSSWQSVPMEGADCGASGMIGYLLVVSPDKPGVHFLGNDFGNVPIQ